MNFKSAGWRVLAVCGLVFTGYTAAAQTASAQNISIVSVKRSKQINSGAYTFNILIDGVVMASVGNGEETQFEVPNGVHSIRVRSRFPIVAPSKTYNFTAASNVISFSIRTALKGIELTPIGSNGNAVLAEKNDIEGIEEAINEACDTLIGDLPQDSTVAVLSVSSSDRNMAVFVIDEIEFQLVNSKQFSIVDRKTLDSIRFEQNFQMSGDVDDSSAVSIGNMLGASVVITGSITGSGKMQRLTVKALDVKTAKIITMAREQF
jgi:TolB-like protein